MSDKTLSDLKYDAHVAVLHTKVDALIEKQKELTQRVRANEKVVAAVTLLGTVVLAVIGAGYFSPKAEAPWDMMFLHCLLQVNGYRRLENMKQDKIELQWKIL